MGEKSLQKKQYILETARKVFVEKGYKNVTMKDIVEACNISRGGLYLYFSSTEELLLAVLQQEAEEIDDIFTETIAEEDSAADILTLFLKEQKKELCGKRIIWRWQSTNMLLKIRRKKIRCCVSSSMQV